MVAGPEQSLGAQCVPDRSSSEARVDGRALRLVAGTWLNLQPMSDRPRPDTVAPFRAILALVAADSGPIPPRIMLDSVWVVWHTQVFSAGLMRDQATQTPNRREGRLWRGPLWLLQADSVDVTLRIRFDGNATCIRAPRSGLRRLE